ncbi:hypothetical protein D0Z07_7785 [Hyphodiscus hymeniophilus]|uniref:C3H1-type domain-containing protein n=1 Tax=Hyphodiscus hymeniophilus TaxID=353542 RepID=A0A9P6SKV2_9HELO|nr:hypothetical protein D0Z07_7785 [Hyphodiscus hymeniophilus]
MQRGGIRLCRFIEQGDHCRSRDNCAYSHDTSNYNKRRVQNTPEQQKEREDYSSWKRLVKKPPMASDTRTIELLWNGALTILNEGDRDWKQMVPRDLDDDENYSSACSNGTRAVPFFQRLYTNLAEVYFESNVTITLVETTLIAILISLREIVKREQRAAFNEELPDLINSLQEVAEAMGIDETSTAFQILPERHISAKPPDIPPPLYARGKGVLFALNTILKEGGDQLSLSPGVSIDDASNVDELKFLEHLIEIGIEKLIRIGGQSKSKILEGKNLRIVSKYETKTRTKGFLVAKSYEQLENTEKHITKVLGSLHATQRKPDWANFRSHLEQRYPRIFSQFSQFDVERYETVGKEPFEIWNQGRKGRSHEERDTLEETTITSQQLIRNATQDVYSLSAIERRRLVELWVQEIHENKTNELFELVKDSRKMNEEIEGIHDEVDRRALQSADVIRVTTTGLAKRISVLQRVRSKVIICEEVGKVMEPHMISALLPSVEHFTQIGDH